MLGRVGGVGEIAGVLVERGEVAVAVAVAINVDVHVVIERLCRARALAVRLRVRVVVFVVGGGQVVVCGLGGAPLGGLAPDGGRLGGVGLVLRMRSAE